MDFVSRSKYNDSWFAVTVTVCSFLNVLAQLPMLRARRDILIYLLEMDRSSANAEVRPKNSAECSARFGSATCDYSAELRPNFGKNSASLLRRFVPTDHVKLNSLYCKR